MERVALITGASRGIGRATAFRLARDGYHVVVNYLRNHEKAEEVVRQIERMGRRAVAVQADVADPDQVAGMFEVLDRTFGALHVLVANAGYSSHYTSETLPLEEWHRALAVNLSGAFYCAREAIPRMRAQGWGRIIFVSSLRAVAGSDHGPHYAAAKAGLLGLAKSLALELGPFGITVNAVVPGYTLTDMTRRAIEEKGDQIRLQIPLRRVAQPEEIAAVIAFLASDDSSYITGQAIHPNGGIYRL